MKTSRCSVLEVKIYTEVYVQVDWKSRKARRKLNQRATTPIQTCRSRSLNFDVSGGAASGGFSDKTRTMKRQHAEQAMVAMKMLSTLKKYGASMSPALGKLIIVIDLCLAIRCSCIANMGRAGCLVRKYPPSQCRRFRETVGPSVEKLVAESLVSFPFLHRGVH